MPKSSRRRRTTRRVKVPCDLCRRDDPEEIGRVKKKNRLVRCRECGHLYLRYRPDPRELKYIYTEDVFNEKYIRENEKAESSYEEDKPQILRFARRRFRTLEKYVRPGKILDIGCALGFYLQLARARGWEIYGVDISEYAVEYCARKLNLQNIHLGEINKVRYPRNFFDAVTMWLLLEHLVDPVGTLRRIARWIKPGGVLGIKTPNAGGLTFRLDRERWLMQRPEEHFCDWTPETLRILLDKVGFEVLEIETEGIYLDRASRALKMTIPRQAAAAVESFYVPLARKLRLGDSLVVFGRKRG